MNGIKLWSRRSGEQPASEPVERLGDVKHSSALGRLSVQDGAPATVPVTGFVMAAIQ